MAKYLADTSGQGLFIKDVAQDFNLRLIEILNSVKPLLSFTDGQSAIPRVLVFPKLNDFAIFLCQEVVLVQLLSLTSFLVGSDSERRLVICHEAVIQKKLLQDADQASIPEEEASSTDQHGETESALQTFLQPLEDEYWTPLEQKHFTDLMDIVGQVEILKPNWEDYGYDMQVNLDETIVSHIIEVYDFPVKFQESDIVKIFVDFKNSFNIVWVDDTHCLLVFLDATFATNALLLRHQDLKMRPILIASRKSKLKISNHSYSFVTPKERPQTLPTVARRMINASLGIRNSDSVRSMEEEDVLRRARAARLKLEIEMQNSENMKFSPPRK